MAPLVLAILLGFLSNEIMFVLGDIGTATSFRPPYLREYCIIRVSLIAQYIYTHTHTNNLPAKLNDRRYTAV